jgi:hypothetical protein
MPQEALFVRQGKWFHPTAFTTGPWRPDAMHGGPPSALIGIAITDALQPDEQVARVNIDLIKPVPLEPLSSVVNRRDVSRRVTHLEIELRTRDHTVASARAVLLRGSGPIPLVDLGPPIVHELVGAEHTSPGSAPRHSEPIIFHRDAIEARFTQGDWSIPGPGHAWMQLRVPVVLDEQSCALSQLLSIADFGSALSQAIAPDAGVGLINVDVNVTLAGNPVGPWFFLQTQGQVSDQGIGLALTRLFDVNGQVGVITQSQIAQGFRKG